MVQLYPWFKFSFLLFLGMIMYDNNMIMSLKQKKRKFEPRIKLNHNIHTCTPMYIHVHMGHLKVSSGLSLRAGGQGFSPATKRVAPSYFYWKIEEK